MIPMLLHANGFESPLIRGLHCYGSHTVDRHPIGWCMLIDELHDGQRTNGVPYYQLQVHRAMLRDRVRIEAYERAIRKNVKPGAIVLDVGAGTGILSIMAARAGAKQVYVEPTRIAKLAHRIVHANRLSDRIKVVQADVRNTELPERVDVIVSEWLGGIGVDENMLPLIVFAGN